jgi:hypothetical protein
MVPVGEDSMAQLYPYPDTPVAGHVDYFLVARWASMVFVLAVAVAVAAAEASALAM